MHRVQKNQNLLSERKTLTIIAWFVCGGKLSASVVLILIFEVYQLAAGCTSVGIVPHCWACFSCFPWALKSETCPSLPTSNPHEAFKNIQLVLRVLFFLPCKFSPTIQFSWFPGKNPTPQTSLIWLREVPKNRWHNFECVTSALQCDQHAEYSRMTF